MFDRKLLAYAAAAGAVVAGGQAAQATAVSRPVNITVSGGSVNLDIDGDGQPDFTFSNFFSAPETFGSNVSAYPGTPNLIEGNLNSPTSSTFKASRLHPSNFVSSGANFSGAASLAKNTPFVSEGFQTGNWPGQSGDLGVEFQIGSAMHFGFVQMSVDNFNPIGGDFFAIHIDAVGWETDANTPIHITNLAPAPEPIGLGALALGAAGLATLRRRRSV